MANLELILSDMENTTSDGTIKHHYVLTTWDFEGDSKEYYSWHGLHRGTIKHISISTDTEKFDFREDNVFRLDENYKPKIYPRGALEFILENLAKSNNKIYDVSGDGVGLGIGSTVIDKELFDYLMDNNLLERDLRRMGFDGKITDRLKKEDNNLESLFGSIFSDLSKFQVYRGQKKSKVNTYKDIEDVFDREINSLQEIGLGNTFSEGITHIRFMYDNKDYVFKIHKEKERAKKEIWTANEARKNPILAPYIAAPETDEIFEHDGHFITLWRHASKPTGKEILEVKEKDIFKEKSYRNFAEYALGVKQGTRNEDKPTNDINKMTNLMIADPLMHKMYVLALFHATMTDKVIHELADKGKITEFHPYELLEEAVKKAAKASGNMSLVDNLIDKKNYDKMVKYLMEAEKQGITDYIHEDAKPDNFFNFPYKAVSILGDFGISRPGSYQRDLGKALADPKIFTGKTPFNLRQYYEAYSIFRSQEEKKLYGEDSKFVLPRKEEIETTIYEIQVQGLRAAIGAPILQILRDQYVDGKGVNEHMIIASNIASTYSS